MMNLANIDELVPILELFSLGVAFGIGLDTLIYCVSLPVHFIYNLIKSL